MRAIVTVVGKDQVGIIAMVCQQLSQEGCNILDISQTVLQEYFTMVMLVDLQDSEFVTVASRLEKMGEEKALSIRMQREDIFNAMHRI